MLTITDNLFALETENTGYYLHVRGPLVENLHYGARIGVENALPLTEKLPVGYGGEAVLTKEMPALTLHQLCLELSPQGKGDYRPSALCGVFPHGGATADWHYTGYRTEKGSSALPDLPTAYGGDETLYLTFATTDGAEMTLVYTVYTAANVITRRCVLTNGGSRPLRIDNFMSYQLDLPACGYTLSTFTGAWARERHETRVPLATGEFCFGSTNGASGNYCNPFFMLSENDATEFNGGVYGFNLVYSGNHKASVSVSPYGKTRVMAGLHPDTFCWTLQNGESFATPEAVLTFSAAGKNGMSANMHRFVAQHIVPPQWAGKERPILINNWEATYFDFNEAKLLKIAKTASKLGMELFVLDDGWFSTRNNDKSGLGDYDVNRKKLPDGLEGLAAKINALGMDFGLWVEPEMCNADSALYRAHPEWAVAAPGITPSEGRNQYVLDLCRTDVQDYIIENVNTILSSAPIKYIKWDMNRPITDAFSGVLEEQGRFYHAYMQGLYRVFRAIMQAHPDVLFEGCSSGGNRFDLGILRYFPQIWTSDDTDAYERQKIQAGTSYGYPQSVMGCHVSASPNHQTARRSALSSRFNVAAFGLLGYELDLTLLSPAEQKDVAAQIVYYKAHRRLLQFGQFMRLASPFTDGKCEWIVVSEDKKEAVAGEFLHLLVPNMAKPPLRLAYLDEATVYEVETRAQSIDIRTFGSLINQISPVKVNADGHLMHAVADRFQLGCEKESYTAAGSLLMHAGIRQKQAFTGTGYNEDVRLMPDFAARLYYIHAVDAAQENAPVHTAPQADEAHEEEQA